MRDRKAKGSMSGLTPGPVQDAPGEAGRPDLRDLRCHGSVFILNGKPWGSVFSGTFTVVLDGV